MKIRYLILFPLLFILLIVINLQLEPGLSPQQQLGLIFTPEAAQTFPAVFYLYGQLPRLCMALLAGATLGLTGSLMQQLTQNNLTSPMTLGTSSGAWLALVILSVSFSELSADYAVPVATAGALLAFAFVILITGSRNITGLPLIVSGMVVNILLGAIATAVITLNSQFAQNIFMWGAGDLTQDGWQNVTDVMPRLLPVLFILLFAPRILTVLRLGHQGAQARGLSVLPVFLLFMVLSAWLVSVVISTAGMIGFIGLLAPNLVRIAGARTALQELIFSVIAGAFLLLFADTLALALRATDADGDPDRCDDCRHWCTCTYCIQPPPFHRAGSDDHYSETGYFSPFSAARNKCCCTSAVCRADDHDLFSAIRNRLPVGGAGAFPLVSEMAAVIVCCHGRCCTGAGWNPVTAVNL